VPASSARWKTTRFHPSLNSLQSIATALHVPMFYFLSESQGSEVVRKDERRQLVFVNSKIGYDLLTPDFTRKMMALLINLKPYARRIAQPLSKPTEQWMYVMQGEMADHGRGCFACVGVW
jgi:transcriptional regulator with XRE-family HTH domain